MRSKDLAESHRNLIIPRKESINPPTVSTPTYLQYKYQPPSNPLIGRQIFNLETQHLEHRRQSVEGQIQSLKNTFPLLKIDFEKIELDLSDLKMQLKKDIGKTLINKKEMSPGFKGIPARTGTTTMQRGNSASREKDSQSESFSKIKKIEEQMEKFKSSLMKREQLVVSLIDVANGETQRSMQSSEGEISQHDKEHQYLKPFVQHLPQDESGTRSDLMKRIQELQKKNDDLLIELKLTNKKLLEQKVDKIENAEKQIHPWKTATDGFMPKTYEAGEKRGHSQSRTEHSEWESEKKELKAQIQILHKELEKTNISQEKSQKEIQGEFGKVKETLQSKLARANDYIHKFLTSMQRLQKGVMKKDDANMENLRKDFELNKTNLINLDKELKEFEGKDTLITPGRDQAAVRSIKTATIIKPHIARPGRMVSEDVTKYKMEEDLEKKMQNYKDNLNKEKITEIAKISENVKLYKEEIAELKKIQSVLTLENEKLKSDIESQKKNVEDEIAKKLNEASENYEKLFKEYKRTIAAYEQGEIRFKKAIKDLDGSLKMKNKEIEQLLKKSNENDSEKMISEVKIKTEEIVQVIEADILGKYYIIEEIASKQLNQLDNLKGTLAEKLEQVGGELARANQEIEKEKMHSLELEKKLALKKEAKENADLRAKLKEMQKDLSNYENEYKKLEEERVNLQQQLEQSQERENAAASITKQYQDLQEKLIEYDGIIYSKDQQLEDFSSLVKYQVQETITQYLKAQQTMFMKSNQNLNKKIERLQNAIRALQKVECHKEEELRKKIKELSLTHEQDLNHIKKINNEKNIFRTKLQTEQQKSKKLIKTIKNEVELLATNKFKELNKKLDLNIDKFVKIETGIEIFIEANSKIKFDIKDQCLKMNEVLQNSLSNCLDYCSDKIQGFDETMLKIANQTSQLSKQSILKNERIKILETNLKNKEKNLKTAQEQIESKTNEIKKLQAKEEENKKKFKLLAEKIIKTCTIFNVKIKEDFSTYTKKLESQSSTVDNALSKLKYINELTNNNKKMNNSKLSKEVNIKTLIMRVSQEMDKKFSQKASEYSKTIQKYRNKLNPMKEHLIEIKEYILMQKTNIKAHKDTIIDSANQIDNKQKSFELANIRFKELLKKINMEIQNISSSYEGLTEQISGKTENIFDNLSSKIKLLGLKYKTQLTDQVLRIEELKLSIKSKERDGDNARKKLKERENKIEELEKNNQLGLEFIKTLKIEVNENNETITRLKKEIDEKKAIITEYQTNIQLGAKAEQARYIALKISHEKALNIIRCYLTDTKSYLNQAKKVVPNILNTFFLYVKGQIAEISRNGNDRIANLLRLNKDNEVMMKEKCEKLQFMMEKSKNETDETKLACIEKLKEFFNTQSNKYKDLELYSLKSSNYYIEHFVHIAHIFKNHIAGYKTEKNKNIICRKGIHDLINSNNYLNTFNEVKQILVAQNELFKEVKSKLIIFCKNENEKNIKNSNKINENIETLQTSLQNNNNKSLVIIERLKEFIESQSNEFTLLESNSSKKIEYYYQQHTKLANIAKTLIATHLKDKKRIILLQSQIKSFISSFTPDCKKSFNDVQQILLKQNEQFKTTASKLLAEFLKNKEKLHILETCKIKTETILITSENNNKLLIEENKGLKKTARDLENRLASQKIDLENVRSKLAELELRLNTEKQDKENVYKSKDEEKMAIQILQQNINKKELEIEQLKAKIFALKKLSNKIRQDFEFAKEHNTDSIKETCLLLKDFNKLFLENRDIINNGIRRRINDMVFQNSIQMNHIKGENDKALLNYQEEIKTQKNSLESIKLQRSNDKIEYEKKIEENKRICQLNLKEQITNLNSEHKKEVQKLKGKNIKDLTIIKKHIESYKMYLIEVSALLADSQKQFVEMAKSQGLTFKLEISKLQEKLVNETNKAKTFEEEKEAIKKHTQDIIDQKEQIIIDMKNKVIYCKEKLTQYNESITRKEKELSSLISKISQNNILEKSISLISSLRDEKINLSEKLKRKDKELQIVKAQRKGDLTKIKGQIKNSILALKQSKNEIIKIVKQNESDLEEAKAKILDNSRNEINALNGTILALKSDLNKEKDKHNKEKKSLDEENIELKNIVKYTEGQINKQKQDYELQINQLNLKIHKFDILKDKIKHFKEEFNIKIKEFKTIDLNSISNQIIDKITRQQNNYLVIKTVLSSLKIKHNSEIQALTLQITKLKEINENYTLEIKEKNRIISKKNNLINELKVGLKSFIPLTKEYLKKVQEYLITFESSMKISFIDYIEKYKKLTESRSAKIKALFDDLKGKLLKKHKDYTDLKNKFDKKSNGEENIANTLSQAKAQISSWIIQNTENMRILYGNKLTEIFIKLNNIGEMVKKYSVLTETKRQEQLQLLSEKIKGIMVKLDYFGEVKHKAEGILDRLNNVSLLQKQIHVLYTQNIINYQGKIKILEDEKIKISGELQAVEILTKKLLKKTEEYNEMVKANEDLNKKINILQLQREESKDTIGPTFGQDKIFLNSPGSELGDRKMSSSSVNTCPVPRKDSRMKPQNAQQQEQLAMKSIKQTFMLCIENVPSK